MTDWTRQEISNFWGWQVKFIYHCPQLYATAKNFVPAAPSSFKTHAGQVDVVFEFSSKDGLYTLAKNGQEIDRPAGEAAILQRLEQALYLEIGSHAPHALFVHAGVIALGQQAVIFPGVGYAGKSTLVHTLVKLGATYLSDEYAVIDKRGQVHPYRCPITLRQKTSDLPIRVSCHTLTPAQHRSYDLSLLLDCHYQKRARFKPQPISQGQAILKLFANTMSARLTPQRDLDYLAAATARCRCFQSPRGEARRVAQPILELLANN